MAKISAAARFAVFCWPTAASAKSGAANSNAAMKAHLFRKMLMYIPPAVTISPYGRAERFRFGILAGISFFNSCSRKLYPQFSLYPHFLPCPATTPLGAVQHCLFHEREDLEP